jgi:hypothetical protein
MSLAHSLKGKLMSDSPYKPPAYEAPEPGRQPVRLVAKYQRWVIFALLGNIVANILAIATAGQDLPVRLVVVVLALAAVVFGMVAIFLLTKQLMNAVFGVVFAIAMILPCISLIVLLLVNQKATSYLQSNGVRVGFLGVNPDSI